MFKLLSLTPELELGENLDTSKPPFVVSINGSITTNIRFRSDLLGHFLLKILVFDIDGFNDTANVKVRVISYLLADLMSLTVFVAVTFKIESTSFHSG